MRTDTHAATQQYRPTADQPTNTPDSAPAATEPEERDGRADATPSDDPGDWVARCQRSFDRTGTDRLTNTTDEANQAMPSGR
ncbi:hypothetical protein [Haloarchaeobius amylolyticus]|uniref:hypothetical protein n=1 Tax=Haloarchaeobius amylolyticus TaxID=1198296 RepID=UPI00226E363D|nr:hypothetical protein [Haloarchaeobius amylolyticus]